MIAHHLLLGKLFDGHMPMGLWEPTIIMPTPKIIPSSVPGGIFFHRVERWCVVGLEFGRECPALTMSN